MNIQLKDFTSPAGKECKISSLSQAEEIFEKKGIKGKVHFGMAISETTQVYAWFVKIANGKWEILLPFYELYAHPLTACIPIEINEWFGINGKLYMYVQHENDKVIVEMNKMLFIHDFEDYLISQGYTDFKLTDINNKFVSVCWQVAINEDDIDGYDELYPVFIEDDKILDEIDFDSLIYKELKPGNIFCRNDVIWQVFNSPEYGIYVHFSSWKINKP